MQADGELGRWLAAHTADATETLALAIDGTWGAGVGEVFAAAISGKDGDAVWFDPTSWVQRMRRPLPNGSPTMISERSCMRQRV